MQNNQTKFKETELGLIPEDWELSQLDEIIDFDPPRKIKKGDNIKFVAMTDVNTFNKKISNFTEREFDGGSKFKNGDTLLSRITPCLENGKTAFVDILNENENAGGSTEFIVMSGKRGRSNSEFVYYLAISSDFRKMAIQAMVGTSGRQRVQVDRLKSHQMAIPPLLEQEKIAEVLGALDEKIELNRKMNKTLESLAQAIFKKRFIDDSDPNWETKRLKDICEIKNGFAFKSGDYSEEGIFLLRTSNFNSEGYAVKNDPIFLPNNFNQTFSNYRLKKFDILLVMVGASVGKRSFVFSNILPALQNQNMWNFRAYNQKNQFFLKFLVDQIVESNIGSASGSARDFFRKDYFREIKFSLPSQNLLDEFYETLLPHFEMVDKNIKEIETLSQIRDSLLPRLMSGKLRVK